MRSTEICVCGLPPKLTNLNKRLKELQAIEKKVPKNEEKIKTQEEELQKKEEEVQKLKADVETKSKYAKQVDELKATIGLDTNLGAVDKEKMLTKITEFGNLRWPHRDPRTNGVTLRSTSFSNL